MIHWYNALQKHTKVLEVSLYDYKHKTSIVPGIKETIKHYSVFIKDHIRVVQTV